MILFLFYLYPLLTSWWCHSLLKSHLSRFVIVVVIFLTSCRPKVFRLIWPSLCGEYNLNIYRQYIILLAVCLMLQGKTIKLLFSCHPRNMGINEKRVFPRPLTTRSDTIENMSVYFLRMSSTLLNDVTKMSF